MRCYHSRGAASRKDGLNAGVLLQLAGLDILRSMKVDQEPRNPKRLARTLSLLALGFMTLVSMVLYSTEDHLNGFDYLLLIAAPIVSSAVAYLVGLYHDRTASE